MIPPQRDPYAELESKRKSEWQAFLVENPEMLSTDAPAPSAEQTAPSHLVDESNALPKFPVGAWRGAFADYRNAMMNAGEASDVVHFGTLWARCAVALGRRVHFSYGSTLFPNVYLVCFGPTGDKKTAATRRVTELGEPFKIISGGGSGEGLADEFCKAEPGQGFLLYAEEFSQILRPGRWDGATLIPFLTQCFDCPPRYEMKFRKSPINLERPTPSLLTGTTPTWFWRDFQERDFEGGFGNRLFFLAGEPKPPVPLPKTPGLDAISHAIDALSRVEPCEAHLEGKAIQLWERFYLAWRKEDSLRDPLSLAAVKRIPAYILKLAMLYAAMEGTLPEINGPQLGAAILVGRYGAECVKEILSLRNAGTNPRKELERRILAYVTGRTDGNPTKREVYRTLARHYKDAKQFSDAFDSLLKVGMLFTHPAGRGSYLVSTEPFS